MKAGKDIQSLLNELHAQARAKKDYVVPTTLAHFTEQATLVVDGVNEEFEIKDHAHGQIAARLSIPKNYYDRMRTEQPDLLAANVNRWFKVAPEKRMLRTMVMDRPQPSFLRAFMSDSYRRLDNIDLARAIFPFMVKEYEKPLQIVSADVTEQKFYLKVIAPHTERDLTTIMKPGTHVRVNEPVRAGFIIQNSEIGMGNISAFPFVEMLRCTNGMTVEEYGHRKRHAGKRIGGESDGVTDLESIYSDQTKMLDDAAFWSKTKDIVRACLADEMVTGIYRKMAEARDIKIEAPPEKVVELAASTFGFDEAEQAGILRTLIDSGLGLNQYGLVNAINQVAGDVESYDRASQLEAVAGKVLTLDPSQWKVLTAVAK